MNNVLLMKLHLLERILDQIIVILKMIIIDVL